MFPQDISGSRENSFIQRSERALLVGVACCHSHRFLHRPGYVLCGRAISRRLCGTPRSIISIYLWNGTEFLLHETIMKTSMLFVCTKSPPSVAGSQALHRSPVRPPDGRGQSTCSCLQRVTSSQLADSHRAGNPKPSYALLKIIRAKF